MKNIKVLVLDFDNCIILDEATRKGSEEVKDEAWFIVFKDYDRKEIEAIIDSVKKDIIGGKGDRNDIINAVLSYYNINSSELGYYSNLFNKIVQEGIIKIGISDSNRKAIENISKSIPIYVNTATPKEQNMESLDTLGINKFFKDVYGRPGTKEGNLKDIISREAIKPEELLFVDDQSTAYDISRRIGCSFIGMHTARNKEWHRIKQPFPIIYSLKELNKYFKFFQ